MASKTFRVGNASDPAIELAEHLAKQDFYQPIAVWDDQDKIVHLFLCGQQFRSV